MKSNSVQVAEIVKKLEALVGAKVIFGEGNIPTQSIAQKVERESASKSRIEWSFAE